MRVVKFGGSSLADAERLMRAARIAARHREQAPVTVVVSAMAGVTDALLRASRGALAGDPAWRDELAAVERRHRAAYLAIAGTVTERFERQWQGCLREAEAVASGTSGQLSAALLEVAMARFSGWGERLIVDLFARALVRAAVAAESFPEEPVLLDGMLLDPLEPSGYRPRPSTLATRAWLAPRLASLLLRGGVPVLPGYIARDASGGVTTLGRNGSDHSAAVVSAALGADALYIYSDVAGIYSADPRVVPEAELLPAVTYAEAGAVALLGARVLHPHTVEPLDNWRIPLHLRSSLAPDAPGTEVLPEPPAATAASDGESLYWVVAARPLPAGDERDETGNAIPEDAVEVTATLIGRDEPETQQSRAALLAAGARALLAHDPAPLRLALTAHQLRAVVRSASAHTAQRLLHAALIEARRETGHEAAPARRRASRPAAR